MKIRWNRNGVRFRITPPELEALLQNRPVTEDLVLPWGGHWSARIAPGAATTCLTLEGGHLRLFLADDDRERLAAPDAEGVYFSAEASGAALRYFIEKDFPCAHPRPPAAREPDTETFAPPEGFKERHRTCA